METPIKQIISDYEELTGKMRDIKDYNSIISNILKKKNSKNQIDILIRFLDNLTHVKNELKSDKKIQKTIYAILFTPNGEENFLKEFLSKLEDRSCTVILNQIKQNMHRFSNFQNLLTTRLKDKNEFFIQKFKSCKGFNELVDKMMESNFIEDNLIHHFFMFWNNIGTINYSDELEGNANSIFASITNFKQNFVLSFKESIVTKNYSRVFVKEMIAKKIPLEFEILFKELEMTSRLKIDLFLAEFTNIGNFEIFLNNLFDWRNDRNKTQIFFDVLNELSVLKLQNKSNTLNQTIFEIIFDNSGIEKFLSKLGEEFCNLAQILYTKCHKFFEIFKNRCSEFKDFLKGVQKFLNSQKIMNKHTICFLEEIKGNSYEVISNNLLQFTLDDYGHEHFFEFLQKGFDTSLNNYILINDNFAKYPPFLDIVFKSKEIFLENLLNSILENKNFKKHRVSILTTALNTTVKISPSMMKAFEKIKEGLKTSDRKEFRHFYSRYLAYEIDIYFLMDFISKTDFEKISLLVNRLIRSKRYEDALTVMMCYQFDSRIHIEEEYEWELCNFYNLDKKKGKRTLRYLETNEEFNLLDKDYDQNFNENLDNEDDLDVGDSDEEEIKKEKFAKMLQNKETSKKKYRKVLDYIMYYQYIRPNKKRDSYYYHNLINYINFVPNKEMNYFGPVTAKALTLDIPRCNILIVDTIENLKKNVTPINKKLCVDFEYTEDTISLIQVSDKNNVYLIDYLKLITNNDFFPVFNNVFKNSSFIVFSMDGSDLKMMNEDFRKFFSQGNIEDVKKMYEKIYDVKNCPSLSNLAFLFLGKPVCKYYQCSNWSKRPLNEGQIHYAALDSYVLYKIYSHLENINGNKLNERKFMCADVPKYQEKKLKERLKTFSNSQIQFLESERQIIEDMNNDLFTKTLDEIICSHKVIRQIRYSGFDESEKIHTFNFRDSLNLIKVGEKVGVFEILKDNMIKQSARGVVESICSGSISIREMIIENEKFCSKKATICIIQLSDDTFKTMINTMKKLKRGNIPKYCLDVVKTSFPVDDIKFSYLEDDLRDSDFFNKQIHPIQKKVVNFSLQKSLPVSLIHGPPGTGKSLVIKEIILQSLKKKEKVLVTAFSNAGCDNLANIAYLLKKLDSKIFNENDFLRIGNASRIKESVKDISLEERENSSIYKICLNKIEKNYYTKEDQILVSERQDALVNKLNAYRDIILEKSGVIFSTCVSSGSFTMRKFLENHKTFFDLVIIDEASQALEAACWIPMLLGKKAIIVGDFNQIGPIVNANNKIFSFTLFEKLYKLYKEEISRMLSIQFRSNKKIMEFSSNYFYEGKLTTDASAADRTLSEKFILTNFYQNVKDPLDLFKEPLIFVNTNGESDENIISTTKYNVGEAEVVKWFVKYLTKYGVKTEDIGIITPYVGQVNYLKNIIDDKINISTVDAFQGSEMDVIIISFVRSNDFKKIGFLSDKKRINVSLTRPKKLLVMICDSETLNSNSFLKEMIEFYMKNSRILKNDIIYQKI